MAICVIGINHKTAELDVRERFSIAEAEYQSHLEVLNNHELIDSAVVISTCNRTEFYLSVQSIQVFVEKASDILNLPDNANYVYTKTGHECAAHLFAVTAGVDSQVLGETQIQGQVKRAFDTASNFKLNGEINKLFQMAFKTAKLVRSDTEIGRNPVSVAHCAVKLGRQIFGSLGEQNILIVGAGETAELLIRYLLNNDANEIVIANRSIEKANKLAAVFKLSALALSKVESNLADFDLVFTATASPSHLITYDAAHSALVTRKFRPMVMIDLSVPRDIDEKIKQLDDVFLYTVDDLQKVITENMQRRESTIEDAMRIIEAEAELLDQWVKTQRHHNLLKQYQQRVDTIKQNLLSDIVNESMSDEQITKFNTITHQVSKKISHENISAIRKVIESGNEEHIKLMAQLFKLDMNDDT